MFGRWRHSWSTFHECNNWCIQCSMHNCKTPLRSDTSATLKKCVAAEGVLQIPSCVVRSKNSPVHDSFFEVCFRSLCLYEWISLCACAHRCEVLSLMIVSKLMKQLVYVYITRSWMTHFSDICMCFWSNMLCCRQISTSWRLREATSRRLSIDYSQECNKDS